MNSPKASITFPAASGPVCPSFNTILVDATFKPRRSTVAMSNKLGKDEKSNGRCVCIATIKINSDKVIFKTKNVSSNAIGSGNTSIATSAIIPNGNSELIKFGPKPLKVIDCASCIPSQSVEVSKF